MSPTTNAPKRAAAIGVRQLLQKPVPLAQLSDAIRAALAPLDLETRRGSSETRS